MLVSLPLVLHGLLKLRMPYIGGTIGMLIGQSGYVTEPHFLTQNLRSQNRFHDPLQDSLFSHAGSVQGYREWSGRSSPVGDAPTVLPADPQGRTLLVRSSRPIRQSSTVSPSLNTVPSQEHAQRVKVPDDVYEAYLPSLITPRTRMPGKNASKSIRYAILEVGHHMHEI